ncbi:anthranilate synthase component I [Sulfobacillus thermotolerans]|uniref:Anthranilate synthase component 1 n=1 Tax=Sulfobacillus thermotolerans TaxID=338644 RepID=A0ABN5H181_9FIRM|nr:anthranilate synthase component I [Sulfobacillus thermotolerans]
MERIGHNAIWESPECDHIAVVRYFAVDQVTPISAFLRLRPFGAHSLLESVEGDDKVARYSFIGIGEWARLLEADGQAILVSPDGTEVSDDPLELIRKQQKRQRIPVPPEVEWPFVGGAIGYFAYNWIRRLEKLPRRHAKRGPDWEWVWPKAVVAFDHRKQQLAVVVESLRDQMEQAFTRMEILVDALRQPVMLAEPRVRRLTPIKSNMTRVAYDHMVEQAKQHIVAGDIFQVVLSQILSTRIAGDAFSLYRKLRHVNPSPYLFYLETPRRILAGSSPEALVRVTGRTAYNRPIAGTRRRGSSGAEDDQLWEELIADPKERAEHVMLVDLSRNDLGRVSEFGTVTVSQLMSRETYSHVMHIVSEVQGVLRPGYDALDALAACFPAGTLTGAPKIRAMEIIEELEPEGRGAYGGVVGYLSHRGDLDACITIRTMDVIGDEVFVQAGGGIVADSESAGEFQESMNKAGAALSVLDASEEEWL